MLIQLLLLTLLQDSPKAEPGEITGKVVSIADGDTITILTAEKKQVKIRFNGIDAPERGQPFGTKSKEMLSHIIGKSDVRVETHGEDRYGRTIGDVFVRTPYSAAKEPDLMRLVLQVSVAALVNVQSVEAVDAESIEFTRRLRCAHKWRKGWSPGIHTFFDCFPERVNSRVVLNRKRP